MIDPRLQPPLESKEWVDYHRLTTTVLDSKIWANHGGPQNEEELRLGMTEDGRSEIRRQIAVAAAAAAAAAALTAAAAPAATSSATGIATVTRRGAPPTEQQRYLPEQPRHTSTGRVSRMPPPPPPT